MTTAEKLVKVAENREKLYEAGKQAEYDSFWDAFYSSETCDYRFAGKGWTDTTFKPNQNMTPTNANYMFAATAIKDLKGNLKRCGVTLDTSKATTGANMFYWAQCVYVPTISTISMSTLSSIFAYASNLENVELLILKDNGTQTFVNPFLNCTSLNEIRISGQIGNNFDISPCPLSKESFESVITALSPTVTGKTVSFKKTAKEAAFTAEEWEVLTATKPNWTFNLV